MPPHAEYRAASHPSEHTLVFAHKGTARGVVSLERLPPEGYREGEHGHREFPTVAAEFVRPGTAVMQAMGIPTVIMSLDMSTLRFGRPRARNAPICIGHGFRLCPQQVYGGRLSFWTADRQYTDEETSVLLFSKTPDVAEVMLLACAGDIKQIQWENWRFTITLICKIPTAPKKRRGYELVTKILLDFTTFQDFTENLGIVRAPQLTPSDVFPVWIKLFTI